MTRALSSTLRTILIVGMALLAWSTSALAGTVVNGRPLTAAQVQSFQQTYGQAPLPGEWWYDARSGLYGPVGGAPIGQMRPGHDYGALASEASNGATGIFVNGRQLPAAEVAAYSSVVGPIAPGRYWLDANGNAGREGATQVLAKLLGGNTATTAGSPGTGAPPAAAVPPAAGGPPDVVPQRPPGLPRPVHTYTDHEGYTWERYVLACQLPQGPGTLTLELSYVNDVGLTWDTTKRPSPEISGVIGMNQKIRYMQGTFAVQGQVHRFTGRGTHFSFRETLDNSQSGRFEIHGQRLAVYYPFSNPTPGYCTPNQ